jgi:hypothetical protein
LTANANQQTDLSTDRLNNRPINQHIDRRKKAKNPLITLFWKQNNIQVQYYLIRGQIPLTANDCQSVNQLINQPAKQLTIDLPSYQPTLAYG